MMTVDRISDERLNDLLTAEIPLGMSIADARSIIIELQRRRAEARQAPLPAGTVTEGLITAVQGLLAHWDRHNGPEKRGEYDGVGYWSPAGRMVDTRFIADLRAALEDAFAARPSEIRYVAVDHTGCIYTCEDEEQAIKIAKDIRDDTLDARPAEPVAVKGLEWVTVVEGFKAITVCGMYAISPKGNKLTLTGMPGNLFGQFKTMDAAKAAAQADYEARIRSALSSITETGGAK